jgi:hypothetical protein
LGSRAARIAVVSHEFGTEDDGREATLEEDTLMRKITVLAVSGAFVLVASTSAFADSKSAAEFLLKTCLPAMDDLSNVEVMARDGNWIPRTPLNGAALSRFMKSNSMWDVAQDEDKFNVNVWISHLGELDFNVCFVSFFSKDANRDEFFNILSASLELIFTSDTRFPQMRGETYEIKNDRPKRLVLFIQSQLDGSVTMSSIAEQRRYLISPAAPPAPSQIGR